jgi:urease accessory protein
LSAPKVLLPRLTRVVSTETRGATTTATLTLAYEDRRRSRWRARLEDGREVAIVLPRGTVLREGDALGGDPMGTLVVVRAAAEALSVARTADPHLLTRAAYHLGNRHVPLQIAPGQLAYQHDHVLDGLARELGLEVTVESAAFEPEAGGYRHEGSSGHSHGHVHHHEHAETHDHDHPHEPRGGHDE